MKFSLALLSVALLSLTDSVSAAANMKAVAAKVDKEAFRLKAGKYRFVNVKTHGGLKYVNSAKIFTAKGKGDWMTISTHHKHVVISPTKSNKKCISAAWNYSKKANSAGALYRCVVGKRDFIPENEERDLVGQEFEFEVLDIADPAEVTKRSLEKRVALRTDKQYFYLHPAPVKNAVHIVAYDHIKDMPTRVLAGTSHAVPWNKKSLYPDILPLNHHDKGQMWLMYNSAGKQVKF